MNLKSPKSKSTIDNPLHRSLVMKAPGTSNDITRTFSRSIDERKELHSYSPDEYFQIDAKVNPKLHPKPETKWGLRKVKKTITRRPNEPRKYKKSEDEPDEKPKRPKIKVKPLDSHRGSFKRPRDPPPSPPPGILIRTATEEHQPYYRDRSRGRFRRAEMKHKLRQQNRRYKPINLDRQMIGSPRRPIVYGKKQNSERFID